MFINVERPEPVKKEVEVAQDQDIVETTVQPKTETTQSAGEVTTNAFMKTFKMNQCKDTPTLMEPGQKRIAISSFPGSGNTWARHLLHMATGHWTGNAHHAEHSGLRDVNWEGEYEDCMDGTTIGNGLP